MPLQTQRFQAQLIHSAIEPSFNIVGGVVQFLVDPEDASGAFGLIRGIMAPGVVVPLHSHADPEVIYVLEGELEFLQYDGGSGRWLNARPGEIICIPGTVKHALRNTTSKSATVLLGTTPNIYGFFRELAKPFDAGQPAGPLTQEDMELLLALSAKHNYWLASPQENAAVGIKGF